MTRNYDETETAVEEPVTEIAAVVDADIETEEVIPADEKPAKKKIAALKARHELEDYFEMKKLRDALDYLFEDEEDKLKR